MGLLNSLKAVAKVSLGAVKVTASISSNVVKATANTLVEHAEQNKGGVLDTALNKSLKENYNKGKSLINHIDTNQGGILDTATNKKLSEQFSNGRQVSVNELEKVFDSLTASAKKANDSNTYSPYV